MILPYLHTRFDFTDAPSLLQNDSYLFSIHCIRPKGKDFMLLVTNGLSSYDQPVTETSAAYTKIELYFCLPDYWDLEKKPWPVTWLNRIAQVPQKNGSWFGPGDTLPAGNPPAALDEKLQASYFLLGNPMLLSDDLDGPEAGFKMLAIIPIFEQEFNYKMQNSGTLLIEKLKAKNSTEMVDVFRQPVARRKFMGMF